MLAVAIATVKIGVFGLFHPVALDLRPVPGQVLTVETGGKTEVLERGQMVRLTSAAKVSGRNNTPVTFELSIPGRIRRQFTGRLQVLQVNRNELTPVVEMDRETAVRAIVNAEMVPGVPFEALKAQAVAVRSYLTSAHNRHEHFDFCDTTHCQFLREKPTIDSLAARATDLTRDMVLMYQGEAFPALYAGNCGGHTRTLVEAGWNVDDYPYFAVSCPVKGRVAGHQIGMCQLGAIEMARRGQNYRQILAHFYPATRMNMLENEPVYRSAGPKPLPLMAKYTPANLLDSLVLFHFPVADANDAVRVERDIVFMGHQDDGITLRVKAFK